MAIENDLKEAIKTESKEYQKLKTAWRKTRLVYGGEDDVHAAGEELLPKLEQQTPEMYEKYKARTRFLNAFRRTIRGLEGTVSRKEPDAELDALSEFEENIDGAGGTIDEYADCLLHEGITIGICGTLVDYNNELYDEGLTVAEAERNGYQPKLCFYKADNIPLHRYGVVKGKRQLVLVVLKEKYDEEENEFEVKERDQWRVLRLNDVGKYEQQLYKETDGGLDVSEAIEPKLAGKPLDFIPFFFHGRYEEPPLYDLVTTNIKHYQLKADHNHGLHYIGLPTPYRTGVDPKDPDLPKTIGPEVIWDIEEKDAKVGYLEFEGKGMDHITEELDTIKEEMAFLGASILVSDQMTNETATKANLRNASETSSLAELVINLSHTFTKALKLFAEWASITTEVWYRYNDDFDISKLTAQEILYRVQSWQSGAFSKRSLYKQLKGGEVELAGEDYEEEEELISKGE